MFRRRGADGVECRFGGEHLVATPRLRVVVARLTEVIQAVWLNGDAESQYWLGWDPAQELSQVATLTHDPLMVELNAMHFVGIDRAGGRLVASVDLHRRPEGHYEVGGMVHPELRGQGFGREALGAVCQIAQGHWGMTRLLAGCEVTNIASQRWLASCGFVPAQGPAKHTLPNGRIIDSLWWERVDATARRRCRAIDRLVSP